jgi:hypothetical protein
MPDQLRRFADTFKDQIAPPDFDLLARESRRRSRYTVVAAGVAATAVVLGVAVWGHAATDDGGGPLPPVDGTSTPTAPTTDGDPTPTEPTSPALTLTADEVVDDPASFISSLAVSPSDPDVAAAVWWHCATKNCEHGTQAALALTTDNWRSRSTLILESFKKPTRSHLVVNALSDGELIVHRDTTYGNPAPADPRLLTPDLRLQPLTQQAVGGRPLRDEEAMPGTVFGGASAWAIDPLALTFRDLGGGHDWTSTALAPNGIIVANDSENRVAYSPDGGVTWRFVPDDAVDGGYGRWAVGAAAPGTIAVLEGNAGCESGCPNALGISRDSGATWSTVDLGGYIGHVGVITSKGTFIYVAGRMPAFHVAMLRSTADSLGDLHVVLGGADAGQVDRLALSESGGTETITACGDDGQCARSSDDGQTWSQFAMR